jgi:PhnB protein
MRQAFSLLAPCDPGASAPEYVTVIVKGSTKEVSMAKAAKGVPEGHQTITPQLILDNAAQTIEWYKRAFGAQEVSRSVGPDGKIMHADVMIGNSHFMVNDPMMGSKGPKELGGKVQMPLEDQFWGDRAGAVADPAGYTWWIASRKEDLSQEEIKQRADEFFKQMASQPSHR